MPQTIIRVEFSLDSPEGWQMSDSVDAWVRFLGPESADGFRSNIVATLDRVANTLTVQDLAAELAQELSTTFESFAIRDEAKTSSVVDRVVEFLVESKPVVQFQRYVLIDSGLPGNVNWLLQIQASCSALRESDDADTLKACIDSLALGAGLV